MMEVVWVFVLGGAVLAWMGLPLRRGRAWEDSVGASARNDLLFQKDNLLATAHDLDFDLETDKLSPEDHRLLRERCQVEAVAVMERLETMAPSSAPPKTIAAVETAQAAPAPVAARFCPRCGRESKAPHKFCTSCGLRLPESEEEGRPEAERGVYKKTGESSMTARLDD